MLTIRANSLWQTLKTIGTKLKPGFYKATYRYHNREIKTTLEVNDKGFAYLPMDRPMSTGIPCELEIHNETLKQ